MKNKIAAVSEFHKAFGLGMNEAPTADLGVKKNLLRYELMREENEEYLEAANNNDLVEVADALGDMLYILCGTIIEHGMQHKIEEVFNEIQRSNMSKLGEDGKPIYREDGKVLKQIKFQADNRDYCFTEQVQLIDRGTFSKMLNESGFILKDVFGDYNLGKFAPLQSDRLILIALKK